VLKATRRYNLYISALQFGGQPLRFLELARAGAIELAISPPIIAGVERVLRDKFNWSDDRVREIEPRLSAFARRVIPAEALDVVKDDPSRLSERGRGTMRVSWRMKIWCVSR
jgi:hypothetical protein